MLIINIFLFFIGLSLLYIGAEMLVRNSSRIALMLRVSPVIVGLTVVAFGTSSPEFLVSFVAAIQGNIDVAAGNIVGSNIANIGLILGISAILRPILTITPGIKDELYWMLGASLVFWLFAFNGLIGHWEGLLLTVGIILFSWLLIRESIKQRQNSSVDDVPPIETKFEFINKQSRTVRILIFSIATAAGIGILAIGSNITIDSAIIVAREVGVSDLVIGLSMVAFGTSLPELATAVISVIKKENEILVGNIIGSNIFNVLSVAGPIALLFQIPIASRMITQDFVIMLLFSLLLMVIMLFYKRVSRTSGFVLFIAYLTYIGWLIINS